MSNNLLTASVMGAFAGLAGVASLESILHFTNEKAIIIQSCLAKSPELTPQVFEYAKKSAENFSQGELYFGMAMGAMAGYLLLGGIYSACKKD